MNDLLKVLDMSEDEQYDRVCNWRKQNSFQVDHTFIIWETQEFKRMSLADLAFRLRDEVIQNSYLYDSMIDVQQYIEGPTERKQDFVFWSMRAKPIHWIIACLIAKEKEDA